MKRRKGYSKDYHIEIGGSITVISAYYIYLAFLMFDLLLFRFPNQNTPQTHGTPEKSWAFIIMLMASFKLRLSTN